MHTPRRPPKVWTTTAISVALLVSLAACGGDEDTASGSTTTSFAGIAISIGTASPDGDGDDSADGDPVEFEDVGRASFTHTIVAGDFLRSIADTYDVEIDDIVSANEWQDDREHLLLPGQEIYLPADATKPPETTETTAVQIEGVGDGDVERVCSGGQVFHYYTASNDTLEVVANRLGVAEGVLQTANQFGVGGRPEWAGTGTISVPCIANWPAHVEFALLVDPPLCTDQSIMGTYTVQVGDTIEGVASSLGVSIDDLRTENLDAVNTVPEGEWAELTARQTLSVCTPWFE